MSACALVTVYATNIIVAFWILRVKLQIWNIFFFFGENIKKVKGKDAVSMKKLIALTLFLLAIAALPCTTAAAMLSPSFDVLATRYGMSKSSLAGYEMTFSELDFQQALCDSTPDYIRIVSLPSSDSGRLKLAGVDVYEGQTIKASNLKFLTFKPASAMTSQAEFSFCSGTSDTEIRCSLYFLNEVNSAPEAKTAAERYTVAAGCELDSAFISSDAEGDDCSYILVSAPKKGSVRIKGGRFCYTPYDNKSGRDSFKYVSVDSFGNYSNVCEVSFNIVKGADITDVLNLDCENAAKVLAKEGVMLTSGERFLPEMNISRIDFLTAVMNILDVTAYPSAYELPFEDCAALTDEQSDILAAALQLGYITGSVGADGALCFRPSEAISTFEAAVILGRCGGYGELVTNASSNENAIPAWAAGYISALNNSGFDIDASGGYMTRAEAANALYTLMMTN